jgi:hypothetical protein
VQNSGTKIIAIINEAQKRTKKKRWPCFFSDCQAKAIKSHSQTVSTSLRSIQENGHVIERGFHFFQQKPMFDW